jgi:paired amphipathic helix protein Sin3a
MRRNQQEETLFRVEDERFEIDMVIDSNATTLRRLEPIAEEISILSRKERSPTSMTECISDAKNPSSLSRSALTKKFLGAGGKKFQYVLDKKILTTIHLYSIMRIYGDFGQTMIKLLFSNPTKTVPIVVKRLRQKDIEWREARNVLNRRWKELVDQNYFKCFDHRSLTWRTLDKRATSTRTLLAEIRDRAANNGMESESSLATKREKAKEEYGTFYEISMGRSLRQSVDLSNYPKPVSSIFTPHFSVVYENISWAHLDAYRILVFALEKGSTISPLDKDRGHRLLRDFIGPLFGISHSSLFGYGVGNSSSMNGRNIHPACSDDGKQHEDAIMEEDACEHSESAAENEATSSFTWQSFALCDFISARC